MEQIYKKARAKVNLTLEILEKREDNYHNIQSVFQKISLYDELFVKKTNTNEIKICTNVEELNSQENILYKTYNKLKEKYETISGVEVTLHKNIPMQAGLAGGSTDCASFILAMNELFLLKMTKEEIEEMGKNLGADVVSCFYRKAVLVEGIGEIITPIDTNFRYYMVIIKPNLSCNTKQMYEKIDKAGHTNTKNISNQMIQALEQNQIQEIANHLYNRFEEAIEEKNLIAKIKEELAKQGSLRKLSNRFWFLCLWYFSRQRNCQKSLSCLKK